MNSNCNFNTKIANLHDFCPELSDKLRAQLLNSKQNDYQGKIKTNRNYYTKTTNMINYPDYGPIKRRKLAYLKQSDPSLLNFRFMNNMQDSSVPRNTQALDCNDIESCFKYSKDEMPNDMEYIKKTYSDLCSNAFSTTYQASYDNLSKCINDLGTHFVTIKPFKESDSIASLERVNYKFGKTIYQAEICGLIEKKMKKLIDEKKLDKPPIDKYTKL